jgi:hypothetical protein
MYLVQIDQFLFFLNFFLSKFNQLIEELYLRKTILGKRQNRVTVQDLFWTVGSKDRYSQDR